MRFFLARGSRPYSVAGAAVAFGVVLLLTAPRAEDWRSLAFVGVALIVPGLVWLVADRWFARPKGAWWWVLVAVAVGLGVWGLALFPAAEDTPFGRSLW